MQQHERRRRLLATPAVCPCEAIAPAPLLASLVALAADVAGRGGDAESFPALRLAAGEAVRIAGLVLAFLDAARDAEKAAVLGLSELHVALQRLRFLLGDLGRRGARLWVLMNAEHAAAELRVALRSVATALDVLPPRCAAAPGEDAAELLRLASEQAWRAEVRPDPEDDRAAGRVRSALARFAAGAVPDSEDARLVLRRVGADTWSGCVEEAAFLEEELLDRLDAPGGEDDNDPVLLAGLMAFAVYCRVVLFDRVDDKKQKPADPVDTKPAASGVAWISPEALQCPITLELMTDPVTVATGQTYDRASIRKWIKSGCRTCPVTGERLRSAELVPNLALRGIIHQHLLVHTKGTHEPNTSSSKHRSAVDRTAAPFGAAAAGGARLAVAFLVSKLSGGTTPEEEQRKVTYEARKLSKRNVFYRSCLVDADAVLWLMYLLASPDATVQDNAVAGLLNLSKHPSGRRALVEAGGVGLVVGAVNGAAKTEARQNAAAVLFYLSSSPEYCVEVGRVPDAVSTLVRLARDGAYRGRKNALVSLHGLLRCANAHGQAVHAGAVPVLADLLASDNDLAGDAVALLARLTEQPAGARAVLASSALVARLADFLGEAAPSRAAREHCVALLAALGRHGGDRVLALLGKLPALMPALYALIADGSPHAGNKARWLVNEIHHHYDQRQQAPAPAPAPPATTAGDRVIRV